MKNVLSSRSGSYGVLERLDIKGVEIGPPDPADAARLKAELARHGLRAMTVAGDIDLVDIDGNKVIVTLRGTCSACPSSNFTLKGLVEGKLREFVSDDIEVMVKT